MLACSCNHQYVDQTKTSKIIHYCLSSNLPINRRGRNYSKVTTVNKFKILGIMSLKIATYQFEIISLLLCF